MWQTQPDQPCCSVRCLLETPCCSQAALGAPMLLAPVRQQARVMRRQSWRLREQLLHNNAGDLPPEQRQAGECFLGGFHARLTLPFVQTGGAGSARGPGKPATAATAGPCMAPPDRQVLVWCSPPPLMPAQAVCGRGRPCSGSRVPAAHGAELVRCAGGSATLAAQRSGQSWLVLILCIGNPFHAPALQDGGAHA